MGNNENFHSFTFLPKEATPLAGEFQLKPTFLSLDSSILFLETLIWLERTKERETVPAQQLFSLDFWIFYSNI